MGAACQWPWGIQGLHLGDFLDVCTDPDDQSWADQNQVLGQSMKACV